MFGNLMRLVTGRLDREEEADFRRCVLRQTDTQIEATMGEQAAQQAFSDLEDRQCQVSALRQRTVR